MSRVSPYRGGQGMGASAVEEKIAGAAVAFMARRMPEIGAVVTVEGKRATVVETGLGYKRDLYRVRYSKGYCECFRVGEVGT